MQQENINGATRIVIGGSEPNKTPAANNSNIRMAGTHQTSVTLGGPSLTKSQPTQMSVASGAVENPNDVFTTAWDANGTPIPGDMTKLTNSATMKFGEYRMTVQNALHLGYLRKTDAGYEVTPNGKEFNEASLSYQQERKDKAIDKAKEIAPDTRKDQLTFHNLVSRGGTGVQANMADAIGAMVGGDANAFSHSVHEIESSAQAQGVEGFIEHFANKASGGLLDAVESQLGHKGDDVLDFVKAGKMSSKELGKYVLAYGMGDISVLRAMENEWGDKLRVWVARVKRGK